MGESFVDHDFLALRNDVLDCRAQQKWKDRRVINFVVRTEAFDSFGIQDSVG